jgi:predicted nucleotidyltransferase
MVGLPENNYEALKDICVKYHVRRLELRGSGLTDEDFLDEQTDLGLFVAFLPLPESKYPRNFLNLLKALEGFFGRHIDLLDLESVKNEFIRKAVSKRRMLLYAAQDQEES